MDQPIWLTRRAFIGGLLRPSSADKRLLEAAAPVSSRSVSHFVRESTLTRADETLADRRTFLLSKTRWSHFQAALEAPTRPD